MTQAGLYSRGVAKTERAVGRERWDGERLREIRDKRGLTQPQLGVLAGLSKGEISRHERNAPNSNPTISVMFRLAAGLKVPVAALLESVGSPIPSPDEESGRVTDRSESTSLFERALAHLDAQAPAEDSVRGDIVKAIAALTRALGREGNTGTATAKAQKIGR